MICTPDVGPVDAASAIASHIGEQILAAYGNPYDSSLDVNEVARAIECVLAERDCDVVDSNTLAFLAAQAMSSVGEANVARRLILFGSGMVRPAEWLVTGGRATWVLDLREMTVYEDAPLELLLFQGVQLAIESIADVWDASRGEGVLGLRHVCATAGDLLCVSRNTNQVAGLIREIKGLCSRKLDQLRAERGWDRRPLVLNLDL